MKLFNSAILHTFIRIFFIKLHENLYLLAFRLSKKLLNSNYYGSIRFSLIGFNKKAQNATQIKIKYINKENFLEHKNT